MARARLPHARAARLTSFLWIAILATLLLAGTLLGWIIYEVFAGSFDDLEGPAQRAVLDDDRTPEHSDPSD